LGRSSQVRGRITGSYRAGCRRDKSFSGSGSFGTDVVAPKKLENMTDVFHKYDPLWKLLTPEASHKVRLANHERLFDQAKKDVRIWEEKQLQAKTK
jgi:hypothetical protein